MPGGGEVVDIEIVAGEIEHDAGISKHTAPAAMLQQNRDAGGGRRVMDDAGKVGATLRQPLHRDAAQLVATDAGDESGADAQQRDIVHENGRRAAERHAEAGGQQFAIKRKGFREIVKDQVEIDLAGNDDIPFGHDHT